MILQYLFTISFFLILDRLDYLVSDYSIISTPPLYERINYVRVYIYTYEEFALEKGLNCVLWSRNCQQKHGQSKLTVDNN